LSSDGCVVLTNSDLNKLYSAVEIGKTPVVISDHVEFVNRTKWNNDRNIATRLVDEWRRDLESMDSKRLMDNYSRQFKSERGEDLSTWFGKQQFFTTMKNVSIKLRDVTFFLYPGRDDLIVGTFTEDATIGKNKSLSIRKRQYWAKEGTQWKIVSESNL
jgi:hypothetical protein